MIKPGETWEEQVLPHGIPGTNAVTLEVSSLRPLNLEKHLDYLVRYPHGCVEQTTSSVFPQLYLNALVRLDDPQKGEIERERARRYRAAAPVPGSPEADSSTGRAGSPAAHSGTATTPGPTTTRAISWSRPSAWATRCRRR